MPFKLIDRLEKLSGRVVGAALTHRDLISNALADRYRDRLPPGQVYPDVHQLHTFITEDLETKNFGVVTIEKRLKADLTEERRGRSSRDSARSRVREHLFAARDIFDGIMGPGANDVIFMEHNSFVRFDVVPLFRQANLVHDNLLDPGFRLPRIKRDIGTDVRKIATDMKPDIDDLGQRIRDLDMQESAQSVAVKETLMQDEETYTFLSVRVLEALAAFAGHPGVARRMRQSTHVSRASGAPDGGPDGSPDGEAAAPVDETEPSIDTTDGAGDPTPLDPAPVTEPSPAPETDA